jgi:uncharacterized protein YndB with AHSA1/START domain
MDEFGRVVESGAIRLERLFPGSIERVWEYLTDSEKRGRWLASGPMDLRPGGAVELRFRHGDLSPRKEPIPERFGQWEGGATVRGRVVRCEPPRLLSYTWAEESGQSEVTFELSPQGEEVLLVVTHRRLDVRDLVVGVAGGWHVHLGILQDLLRGREPAPFWSAFLEIEPEYEARIPADA